MGILTNVLEQFLKNQGVSETSLEKLGLLIESIAESVEIDRDGDETKITVKLKR